MPAWEMELIAVNLLHKTTEICYTYISKHKTLKYIIQLCVHGNTLISSPLRSVLNMSVVFSLAKNSDQHALLLILVVSLPPAENGPNQ